MVESEVEQVSTASHWTDRFGSVASTLCAIHCALCGLLPAAFTALGLGFLLGHEAEWMFSITAIVLGLFALILGWRQHRSSGVAALLVLGVVGLLSSRLIEMSGSHGDGSESEVHDETDGHDDDQEGEHHDEHDGDETAHLVGTVVGVMAGVVLLFGHLSNMRAIRRCREECCELENGSQLKPMPTDFSNLDEHST